MLYSMMENREMEPGHGVSYSEEIRTTEEASKKADELRLILEKMGWDKESSEEAHLAFIEGLANAVIHGNRNDPDKAVTFSVNATPAEATVVITDHGEGFNRTSIPDPTKEGLLKTSGRGIYLIEKLTDAYEYSNGGRTLTMVKKRKSEGAPRGT